MIHDSWRLPRAPALVSAIVLAAIVVGSLVKCEVESRQDRSPTPRHNKV